MGDIYALGVNFKTAPVEVREGLACNPEEIRTLLPLLKTRSGVEELCILSTCNRVEIYAYSTMEENVDLLLSLFLEEKGLKEARKHIFLRRGEEAVFHVFKVASSLDSMVVGEPQIVAQFKESFGIARELGTTGKILNRLFEKALRASKRVRLETGISRNAVSVSYAAVELAKKIFGDLKKAKVLLVGAGEMGELAANYLKRIGCQVFITNRTYERALKLSQELGGNALRFEELEDFLPNMDIVIVSTGADRYVLTEELIKRAMKRRNYEPMFLIDISVPRNIEPSVGSIDEVFLYDIDDLREVVESNLKDRLREAKRGEIILWDEVKKFMNWMESLKIEPFILKLKEKTREMERENPYMRRLVFRAIREMKRNPDAASIIFRIFNEEVKDVNGRESLSYVYNRADGA
ncbi:glutamyl-tRNA reductase [Hydrogenivirga sp. 128-5-R1-1]|uniref:glutamyl-tRNA reductase n=1 Tax=Hydrogenivirga sp. 128-5-R1-1 TaxID=392423 RepID=UPI00015F3097|nr:glutamyl-tRNA reductase [Hydrogenivirga sp. 128-5-R1-1]EDP74473.1 glutamyl tRNA reductase (delta-aminolevulinate synthase) [Hydrogenivirga sp. 128-5-R1-1]